MNIEDVDAVKARHALESYAGTSEPLKLIFFRQTELIRSYVKIESDNGFWKPDSWPVDLHSGRAQLFLKDLSWRTTEEAVEAMEALTHGGPIEHVREELADGLHFITELAIYSGFNAIKVSEGRTLSQVTHQLEAAIQVDPDQSVYKQFMDLVVALGWSMHCLKNKPWKSTQILTDEDIYVDRVKRAYMMYLKLMVHAGMDAEMIVNTYVRKSEVNLFRIRSNY